MMGKPVDEFHDTMQFKAVDNALPNGGLNVHICGFTPEQAIAATLGSDDRYDAGFANGVKATLQQLYGLLHEYPTVDEIEAWADRQWEEEVER